MKTISVVSIGLLSLSGVVVAKPNPPCVDACYRLAKDYSFAPCAKKKDPCRCKSPVWLGTMALCVQDHCDHDLWDWVDREICQIDGELTKSLPSLTSITANASQFSQGIPKNETKTVYSPIVWDDTTFDNAYWSSVYFIGNKTDSSFFG